MSHALRFSRSQWQPAWRGVKRHGEWVALLYAVTVSVVANRVQPDWPATNPLFLIAIGLPILIFRRNYIGATIGVVSVLAGVVWLTVLAQR